VGFFYLYAPVLNWLDLSGRRWCFGRGGIRSLR